jgi:Acetyltransferase (GNAT) domain
MAPEGYLHPAYAGSLAEFGTPRFLPRSGGWLLERTISGSAATDAIGCYPLFACEDWSQLHLDLDDLSGALVCVALVADPFGAHTADDLEQCFPDRLVRFKDHFVVDLDCDSDAHISKHHRYYAQRAMSQVSVERCDPAKLLGDWVGLYATLTERHGLKGIKAFSPSAFAMQLDVPGIVALRATHQGETVGAHLWFRQGEVVYSHLAAVSPRGYELMTSYALHWTAIQLFRGSARWIDLGAGAGTTADGNDGLAQFKRGWATGTRPAFFCGRVLDRDRYNSLTACSAVSSSSADNYFPAFRAGEFR